MIISKHFVSLVKSTSELSLKDDGNVAKGEHAHLLHVDAKSLKEVRPFFTKGIMSRIISNLQ